MMVGVSVLLVRTMSLSLVKESGHGSCVGGALSAMVKTRHSCLVPREDGDHME